MVRRGIEPERLMPKLAWVAAVAFAACAVQSPPSTPHRDVVIAARGEAPAAKAIDAGTDPDACARSDDQASAFLDQARRASDRDRALDAAERYVDRMEHVATGDRRISCFIEMQRSIESVVSARCAPSDRDDRDCAMLQQIDADIERMRAEKEANDAEETNDSELRRRAADRFFAIAHADCAGPPVTNRCDEIVYNAAILYLRAGDRRGAEAARSFFRDPRNSLATSPLAAKLDCVLEPSDAATCR